MNPMPTGSCAVTTIGIVEVALGCANGLRSGRHDDIDFDGNELGRELWQSLEAPFGLHALLS